MDEMTFLRNGGLDLFRIDRERILKLFEEEMNAGLAGKPSSLLMIPSFITIDRAVRTNTPVVVLDAGGTNLRTAVVSIDADGRAKIGTFAKRAMPGADREISADAFYDAFAEFLKPVVKAADSIGFCFSYPAEVMPDCDARLLYWSKEIKVPEVVNTLIGSSLRSRLAKDGFSKRIVILNDTVATLLAGKIMGVKKNYSAYVGLILGTGTNIAYVEKNALITKRTDLDPAGSMAINVESGNFHRLAQSSFDERMDAATVNPGAYPFEKMIAGVYLGQLGLAVLKSAAEAGFFSVQARRVIAAWPSLSTMALDDFCGNKPRAGNPFLAQDFSDADRISVRKLCTPIFERAAILTALNIASAVLKTDQGHDPESPVCVNIDGSTFYKTLTADFQNRVKKELAALLAPRGIHYELVKIADSPVIGAAVAGLMQ